MGLPEKSRCTARPGFFVFVTGKRAGSFACPPPGQDRASDRGYGLPGLDALRAR